MNEICLDTNVIVGALCPDEKNEVCDRVLEHVLSQNRLICVPGIFNFEVPGVLNRKEKLKLMRPQDTDRIMSDYFNLPVVLIWNDTLMQHAMSIQREINIAFYDSCYVAAAHIKDIPLITSDQELIRKGRKIHKAIFAPEDFS